MEDSYNFLRNLIKLSQCNRRGQKPASPAKLAVAARNKRGYVSDDSLASTEPGDTSSNEFSEKSYMTDGSSRRAAKTSVRLVNKSVVRPPPGLTAPPGLTYPWTAPASVAAWKRPETLPLGPKDNLTVLQEALMELSPEQANTVRTFLDQKAAADEVQQGGQQGGFALSARTHPAGHSGKFTVERPFTPFGCASRDQVIHLDAMHGTKIPSRYTMPQRSGGSDKSLKDHLKVLSELDTCARVLMVRRINRLGLDSPILLKDYFKKFGHIDRVLVAHTQCKVKGAHSTTTRVRPAPLGFVIMSTPEEANAALAHGTEHAVQPGVEICAYPFESHTIDE